MQYPVVEIFTSIQGEGYHVGQLVNFIRLAGCPNACEFCDTDFSKFETLNLDEICSKLVSGFPVVITGGEPCIHDLEPLCSRLRYLAYPIHLETSGVALIDFKLFDWITISPKKDKPLTHEMQVNEAKWLVPMWSANEIDISLAKHHFVVPINNKTTIKILNVHKCLAIMAQNPHKNLRLSVQLHKLINVK